jgi:hypothetical protein
MNILTRYYAKDADLVTRDVAGETIVVPIKNKVGDLNSIFTLNEIGTVIWGLIDGKRRVERDCQRFARLMKLNQRMEKDTSNFLIPSGSRTPANKQ